MFELCRHSDLHWQRSSRILFVAHCAEQELPGATKNWQHPDCDDSDLHGPVVRREWAPSHLNYSRLPSWGMVADCRPEAFEEVAIGRGVYSFSSSCTEKLK